MTFGRTVEVRGVSEEKVQSISATTTPENLIPPILLKIAQCESGGRQFNKDGSVLRGKVNPQDVGLYQINEFYHLKQAQEMGIDIYTEEGNEAYALYLYDTQGTKPWNWSKGCWDR